MISEKYAVKGGKYKKVFAAFSFLNIADSGGGVP